MANIIVDKSALSSNAIVFEQALSDLTYQINSLSSKIDSLETSWKSDDGINYVLMLRENYMKELNKVSNDLKEFKTRLGNMGVIYSAMDESYGKKKIGV